MGFVLLVTAFDCDVLGEFQFVNKVKPVGLSYVQIDN